MTEKLENAIEKLIGKVDNIQSDITDLKVENAKQSLNISINTKDLTEHKEGVIQNREHITCLEKNQARVEMIWKVILGLGALSGTVFTILKLITFFGA